MQETLKLLDTERWEGRLLAGREFVFNGTICAATVVEMPVRPDCPAHDTLDPELVIPLVGASAVRTTAAELLAQARALLGPTAVLELNFELAIDARCPACRDSKRLLRPVRKVFLEDIACERCGREGYLVTTHVLGTGGEDYTEDFLDLPLAALGVPALDILEVRGPNGASRYFELAGDAAEALSFTSDEHEAAPL